MNKKQYLKRLERALKNAPRRDREQYLDYYSELIDDAIENGRRERDIVAELESPETVAEQWLMERAGDDYVPPAPARPYRRSEPRVNRRERRSGGGGTVAKVAFSPLFLLLGFIACIIGLVTIIVWTTLIVAFFALTLGLGVGGVYMIVMSFGLFGENVSLALFQIGAGIALCGIGTFMEVFVILLAKSYAAMWRFVWRRNRSDSRRERRGKSTLGTAIVGLVLVLVGGGMGTVFFGMLGFDYRNLAIVGEVSEKTLDISLEELDLLTLNADNLSITVIPSEEDGAKIVYNDFEKNPRTATFENGVITIDSGYGENSFKNAMSNAWNHGVFYSVVTLSYQNATLYLPEDYLGGLKISVNNGSVIIRDHSFDNVEIVTDNGMVKVSGVTCDLLSANVKNGAVSISDVTVETLSANTDNGAVTAERIIGKNISFFTKNGATSLISVEGNRIEVKTSNGFVKVNRIVSSDIYLEASNGAITGSIIGQISDYAIDAHTSNGTNNLNNKSDGDNSLYAHTSNGAISIEFVSA